MIMRNEIRIDRSSWSAGLWDSEPDSMEWIDNKTGFHCLAVRNGSGAWCGYVGIPPSHPWYEINYAGCTKNCGDVMYCNHSPENLIAVHGGLTYSDGVHGRPWTGLPGFPANPWWFGFDCHHAGDIAPGHTFIWEKVFIEIWDMFVKKYGYWLYNFQK